MGFRFLMLNNRDTATIIKTSIIGIISDENSGTAGVEAGFGDTVGISVGDVVGAGIWVDVGAGVGFENGIIKTEPSVMFIVSMLLQPLD
jgi:hypothetical protein